MGGERGKEGGTGEGGGQRGIRRLTMNMAAPSKTGIVAPECNPRT